MTNPSFIVVEDAYKSERGVFDAPVLFVEDDVKSYKERKKGDTAMLDLREALSGSVSYADEAKSDVRRMAGDGAIRVVAVHAEFGRHKSVLEIEVSDVSGDTRTIFVPFSDVAEMRAFLGEVGVQMVEPEPTLDVRNYRESATDV